MGYQRGLDANHANFNANRREDAIRANLAKRFKNRYFSANRFARIDSKRWCANRLPTKRRRTPTPYPRVSREKHLWPQAVMLPNDDPHDGISARQLGAA